MTPEPFNVCSTLTFSWRDRIAILFGRSVHTRARVTPAGDLIEADVWVEPLIPRSPHALSTGGTP